MQIVEVGLDNGGIAAALSARAAGIVLQQACAPEGRGDVLSEAGLEVCGLQQRHQSWLLTGSASQRTKPPSMTATRRPDAASKAESAIVRTDTAVTGLRIGRCWR